MANAFIRIPCGSIETGTIRPNIRKSLDPQVPWRPLLLKGARQWQTFGHLFRQYVCVSCSILFPSYAGPILRPANIQKNQLLAMFFSEKNRCWTTRSCLFFPSFISLFIDDQSKHNLLINCPFFHWPNGKVFPFFLFLKKRKSISVTKGFVEDLFLWTMKVKTFSYRTNTKSLFVV